MKEKTVFRALAAIGRLDGEEAWLLGRSAARDGVAPFEQMMQAVARGYRDEKERQLKEHERPALASNLASIPREERRFPLADLASSELVAMDRKIEEILRDELR